MVLSGALCMSFVLLGIRARKAGISFLKTFAVPGCTKEVYTDVRVVCFQE